MSDNNKHPARLFNDEGDVLKRQIAEYDGIYGTPPEHLIPLHYRTHFIRIRNRLLDDRGYTHDALMEVLDWYRAHTMVLDAAPESDFIIPKEYPNGDPVDWHCFIDEIELLAWLRWCVKDLDPKARRKQLDYGVSDAIREKGRDSKHKLSRESKEWCIKEARATWKNQVESGDIQNVNKVAEDLFDELIKNRMWCPQTKYIITEWLRKAHKDSELVIPNYPK